MSTAKGGTPLMVVDIAPEFMANWLLRELPVCALRGIAREDLAAPITDRPAITARTMRARTGLRRYQPPLRRAALDLSEKIGEDFPPAWELEAFMYVEIGPHIWDLVHDIETALIHRGGHHAGFWAVRVLASTYLLNPSATTAYIRQSYQAFLDTAILDGLGRLELCS